MILHVHRNSFNAGVFSPLMNARVDAEKYAFSCRILDNFIPKVYGGAFRRPGTMYLGRAHDLAEWIENTNPHRILFADDVAPTVNDDTLYAVGSIWLRDQRTLYKASSVTAGAASWGTVSGTHNLYSNQDPSELDDSGEGYSTSSLWYNEVSGQLWKCTDATNDAAIWAVQSGTHNLTATTAPGANDDTNDGYTTNSYWIRNVRTVYKCADNTEGAAVWNEVTGTNNLAASRVPTGADTGYSIGKVWIWQNEDRAWELSSLDHQEPVRLIDFNVSATTRYVLAFGDGYVRFWNADGTPFLDRINSPDLDNPIPLQLATPYSAAEIFDVQIAQLGNLAYFAHPSHPPQKLSRFFNASFGASTFQWSEVQWSFPAFRDTHAGAVTATPSATSGSPVSISFSENVFIETLDYSRYTGARIMLAQRRAASHTKLSLANGSSAGSSSGISVLGEYEFYTYGTFTGTVSIEAQDTSGAWKVVRTFEGTDDRQIVFRSATDLATTLRITRTAITAGADPAVAYLEAADSRRVGYARILSGIPFSSSLPVVPCAVELDFDATSATTEWAIEAWAEYAGYPRAVAFHEQRLWFGGTELQPNTIWASAINDFENFRRGAFDNDSLAFTLAAQEGSAIQSILSHEALVIFTQSEEWTASTSEQTAITPSNIFVRRQSRFGSAHRQAFVAANNLLFVQRGGRKLRQFQYGAGGGQGQASDLTLLAEHITRSGIKQLAFQQQPDPILWCVTTDGALISLTYEPDQGVIAWASHSSGTGVFESVAVIYGDAGAADEVWLTVKRGDVRLFERLDPDAFTKLESGDTARMIYLDSAVIVENDPASATVTGLDHLEGESVGILADSAVQEAREVDGGEITLDAAAEVVVVGLPYTSTLQPSSVDIPQQSGTSQGRRHVCKQVTLNLWKTYGLEIADSPTAPTEKWFPVTKNSTETPLGEPEPLVTGYLDADNMGAHNRSVDATLRQTLPLPCNVLAMIPQISVSET